MRDPRLKAKAPAVAGPGLPKDEKLLLLDKSFLPVSAPSVNMDSPKLWRAFRKFNRNFKRIGRLQEENAVLLEEMRRLQGVPA